jgi:raffinose/stachyose/melibiose transport system substrate-binding protein
MHMLRSPRRRQARGRRGRPARLLTAAAAALCVPAALAACGTSSSGGSAGSATSGSIVWWGWTPTVQGAQAYIKAFNKVYPHIHVSFKEITIAGYDAAMRPALASAVGPDVFDIAPGGGIGSIAELATYASNLQPAIAKTLGPGWKSKIAPIGPAGLTTSGGKLAALPIGSTFAGNLWINQNLFARYHLTAPKTLPQWAHVCSVFKSHGMGCFVQGAGQVAFNQDTLQEISDSIQPGVWTKCSRGQMSWNNPTIVKALAIWKQMFADGIMEPGALGLQQYPDANNAFMASKDAMVMMGTWYMQYATQAGMPPAISAAGVGNPKPFTMMAIPFPDVAGAGHPATMFGDADYGIAVNSKSAHQAAATTFATWLTTSKAGQQVVANLLNDIPSLKGVQPNWNVVKLVNDPAQRSMLQQLIARTNTVTEPRLSLVSANLQQAIGVASTTVAAGKATPAQAAAALEQTMKSSAGQQ